MRRSLVVLAGLVVCGGGVVSAAEVDYLKQVKPLLAKRCFACHGALAQKSGLRLDTAALIQTGGDSGAAIEVGKSGESLLIDALTGANGVAAMPPEGEGERFSPAEVALIRQWIDAGAPAPEGELPEADPREHWAFKAPVKAALPAVANAEWAGNPIDAFIAAQHVEHGLTPTPLADKASLLRRVTLDLTGLPPTRAELDAFLADDSPQAYERVVDRLLASPQYGERWARHWMDVWRYSDWYGRRQENDVRNSYGMIWRWRDWIVRSLNEDKGYDQMVREMLAADEVCPEEDENQAATGYIARNFYSLNYNNWMRDMVEHTGKAFLGLTFNCAHCHDHKYDPVTQEEYFKFRAFFEPLEMRHDRVAGEADPGPFKKYIYASSTKPMLSGRIRIFDENLKAETFMYRGGDERERFERPPVAVGGPAILGGDQLAIAPVELPVVAWYPGMKPFIREEERARLNEQLATAEKTLAEARAARDSDGQAAAKRDALAAAMAEYDKIKAAAEGTKPIELGGIQALLLNAVEGRRTLTQPLEEIPDNVEHVVVRYTIQLVQDAHVNFQLALDASKGATGGFVAFEKGVIKTYQPGGFTEFAAGRYDLAAGQTRFAVTLDCDLPQDRFQLTVVSLSDNKVLVDQAPAALNGWKGLGGGKQGLFLDARPGSLCAYDDFRFGPREGEPWLAFDFEAPVWGLGKDVVGQSGWRDAGHGVAPGRSVIAQAFESSPALQQAELAVAQARAALEQIDAAVRAAEARQAAVVAESASLEARIAADDVRYQRVAGDAAVVTAKAIELERASQQATAAANLLDATRDLRYAEALPLEQKDRDKALAAAQTKLKTTQQARDTLAAAAAPTAYTPLSPVYPQQSTGRRKALVEWMTRRDHPLTARVAVNHVWRWHFGRPIVDTPQNFGRNGQAPTHPELLDWLAVELMERGWQLKPLHRLIVLSRTYRGAAAVGKHAEENLARDPLNKRYWQMIRRRVESEVLRDSILATAGALDLKLGGPEIPTAEEATTLRRSLYFTVHPEAGGSMKFIETFDAPDPCDCYKRSESIIPQQALALTNSPLLLAQSKILADRLTQEVQSAADPDAAFVTEAFRQILTRPPTTEESQLARTFLTRQRDLVAGTAAATASARARESLVRALFSHHDFVTLR